MIFDHDCSCNCEDNNDDEDNHLNCSSNTCFINRKINTNKRNQSLNKSNSNQSMDDSFVLFLQKFCDSSNSIELQNTHTTFNDESYENTLQNMNLTEIKSLAQEKSILLKNNKKKNKSKQQLIQELLKIKSNESNV